MACRRSQCRIAQRRRSPVDCTQEWISAVDKTLDLKFYESRGAIPSSPETTMRGGEKNMLLNMYSSDLERMITSECSGSRRTTREKSICPSCSGRSYRGSTIEWANWRSGRTRGAPRSEHTGQEGGENWHDHHQTRLRRNSCPCSRTLTSDRSNSPGNLRTRRTCAPGEVVWNQ